MQPDNLAPQAATLLKTNKQLVDLMKKDPAAFAVLNNIMIAAQMNHETVKLTNIKSDGISFHVTSMRNKNAKRLYIDRDLPPAYNVVNAEAKLGYEVPITGLNVTQAQIALVAPAATPRG